MLFMVIERFKGGDIRPVGERFRARGRLMPENIAYVSSWVEPSGASCYQVMEAPDRAALNPWLAAWDDLVDFEVIEVLPSAEFWKQASASAPSPRSA